MTIGVATFVDKHRNVVLEIRDGDKILAWASFTPAQAKSVATQIHDLADMAWSYENRTTQPPPPRPDKEPPHRGPRPGRGYHEEDAESNEEGS